MKKKAKSKTLHQQKGKCVCAYGLPLSKDTKKLPPEGPSARENLVAGARGETDLLSLLYAFEPSTFANAFMYRLHK